MAPSAIPTAMSGMRQHEDLGELGEDGIRRERGSERKLEKVLVGNKHVGQRDMVAAGALEAERVPGVPDLPVFGRHETGADHRAGSVRGVDGRTALHHHASARDPLGALASAGKRPCAGNPPSAWNALGRADRLTRTGNDVILSVLVDLLTQGRARQERHQGPDVANHGIPAHRPIEPGQGRDRPKGAQRIKFKAAVTPRYEHAVNPRRPESGHELRRQSPTLLNVGSEPRDHRRERGDARKHLIQCGLVGALDVAGRRPLLVEKRCHQAILWVGSEKAAVWSWRNYGSIAAHGECVSNVT